MFPPSLNRFRIPRDGIGDSSRYRSVPGSAGFDLLPILTMENPPR